MNKNIILSFFTIFSLSIAFAKDAQKNEVSKAKEVVCSGADKSWVKEQSTRDKEDLLFKYALSLFGAPTQCLGQMNTVFEGSKFGMMTYNFDKKATLVLDASPPESSSSTLEVSNGFDDEKAAIQKIQEVVKKVGLNITLDKPEIEKSGLNETKTFWDPSEGTNGRLFLVYKNKKLVSIGYGMAL